MIPNFQSNFLPFEILILTGKPSDYRTLSRFHYLPKKPATWSQVMIAVCRDDPAFPWRIIGVGVLSYPSSLNRSRHRIFGIKSKQFGERLKWVNQNLRTISRVIVHPQFRSIGLAAELIRSLIKICPTRFVEASARMGRVHPLFDRAGMHRFDPQNDSEPLYYWIDRYELSDTL